MWTYKGVSVSRGDKLALRLNPKANIPLPEVEVAVINVENGILDSFSTLIAPFGHDGFFPEDVVDEVMVVETAEVAIPSETRGRFQKDQLVTTLDGTYTGKAIAAFDGIISLELADKQLYSGGINHFRAA